MKEKQPLPTSLYDVVEQVLAFVDEVDQKKQQERDED